MRLRMLALSAVAGLAACGQSGETDKHAAAAPRHEKPRYCFFKDPETKGWTAARGKDGNVIVKGKVYRSDSRYKAVVGDPKVSGSTAVVWPSITVNDTGFAAPSGDDWWDVSLVIPGSAAVDMVDVNCGSKTFAELKVPLRQAK